MQFWPQLQLLVKLIVCYDKVHKHYENKILILEYWHMPL